MNNREQYDSGFEFEFSTAEGAASAHQLLQQAPIAKSEDPQFASQSTFRSHRSVDADGEQEDSDKEGEIMDSPPTPKAPHTFEIPGEKVPDYKSEANTAEDETKALLLIAQESVDQEMDDLNLPSYPPPPLPASAICRPQEFSDIGSGQSDWKELRRQYEATATSRPRSSTPVSMCQLEEYIENMEKRMGDSQHSELATSIVEDEKMKIKIPTESVPPCSYRHKRRSSMSWNDFYDKMASELPPQTGNLRSGAMNPPTHQQTEEDLLETNPEYRDIIPPAPVVNRRTSMEWTVFDDEIHAIDPFRKEIMAETLAKSYGGQKSEPESGAELIPAEPTLPIDEPTPINDSYTYDYSSRRLSNTHQIDPYNANMSTYDQDTLPSPLREDYFYPGSEIPNQTHNALPEFTQNLPGQPIEPLESSDIIGLSESNIDADIRDIYATSSVYDSSSTSANTIANYPANYKLSTENYPGTIEDELQVSSTGEDEKLPNPPPVADSNDSSVYHSTTTNNQYSWSDTSYKGTTDYSYTTESHVYPYVPSSEYAGLDSQANNVDYGVTSSAQWDDPPLPDPPAPPIWDADNNYEGTSVNTTSYDYSMNISSTSTLPPPPPIISSIRYNDDWDTEIAIAPSYVPPHQIVKDEQITVEHQEISQNETEEAQIDDPKEEEKVEETDDWKSEYEKLTARLNLSVQQTQDKMKEMKENTAINELPERPYELRSPSPPPPEDLMHMDQTDTVKSSDSKEWKPISQVLNDEIRRQKELSKPKRPPPPKGAPNRPPPPRRSQPPDMNDWDSPQMTPSYEQHSAGVTTANDHALNDVNDFMQQPPSTCDVKDDVQGSLMKEPQEELPPARNWAPIDSSYNLAPSDSGFFSRVANSGSQNDAFACLDRSSKPAVDPFAPVQEETLIMLQSYDPFQTFLMENKRKLSQATESFIMRQELRNINRRRQYAMFKKLFSNENRRTKTADEMLADAREKAAKESGMDQAKADLDFFGGLGLSPNMARENGGAESPVTSLGDDERSPSGFEDDFRREDGRSPSPLFDEDDSAPLEDYPDKFEGDGWELMLRYPLKKKLMSKDRYWKPVYVRLGQGCILLFQDKKETKPFHELPLQANYCLSDLVLQQYDIYGKIHTVKLQFVVYKERVGLRPGQIPKLVEGHFSKLGLPLEHAAQSTVLLKFGSLKNDDINSFTTAVEDILFKCQARRENSVMYKQDEIQVHCYDEYHAHVDKEGHVSKQLARVRMFCLAFVSGMPAVEIGLNDRRRQGKEIVRRKDILPMYTERWIRFEALEFNSLISLPTFDKEQVIRFMPPDGIFFEIMRFRVRPPPNKETPLNVKAVMKIAGSKIEIRLDCMVAAFRSRKARQVPCEDIQIRFPIPEAWIYLFREERHWGYGSVHSKGKRPGKVKNLKDRLMGVVQSDEKSLIEAAIGDAKYEHVHRALVWRIPRLPEKHHAAYKNHLLCCKFELSSFDLMPEQFTPNLDVEFTMPIATVSHTVVRSVSLDAHEDPDKVEKYVRYVAKYNYAVEIDYVQTTELDMDAVLDPTNLDPEKAMERTPEIHRPEIDPNAVKEAHDSYRIDFTSAEIGGGKFGDDSSSDEDDKQKKFKVEIDMAGYGY